MDVGFIGAGRMGRVMIANLVKAGHIVRAFDATPAAVADACRAGASAASSAADAFGGDAVISMLPNDKAMRAVFGPGGILPAGGSATVHVNMATASVDCATDLTAFHKEVGVPYLAAPVFGRPEMAAERQLNIMAAGDEAAIARVQPLFDAMGKKTWRLGPDPRQANVAKIAGNLMVACMLEAMGEASVLAKAYGLEPKTVLDTVVGSLFDVPIYRIYSKFIGAQEFEPPGFDMRLGFKDAKLALDAGEAANAPLPFASALRDIYLEALAHGGEGKDWSGLTEVGLRRAALD
jgi:3-hydroxyisobutyrate dehydrogenase-like beta-hydroxyacid dehydrogenase